MILTNIIYLNRQKSYHAIVVQLTISALCLSAAIIKGVKFLVLQITLAL